jgi:hypothetical protein
MEQLFVLNFNFFGHDVEGTFALKNCRFDALRQMANDRIAKCTCSLIRRPAGKGNGHIQC